MERPMSEHAIAIRSNRDGRTIVRAARYLGLVLFAIAVTAFSLSYYAALAWCAFAACRWLLRPLIG
jgi:hypothetical protein